MSQIASSVRHVVGVMTGTSIDGIDAAMVCIDGIGLSMSATLVQHHSMPLGNMGTRLRAAAEQQPMAAGEFANLAREFGELHNEAIDALVRDCGITPELICVHGQTVYHQPPTSWQLINPAPIAQRFDCPVVFDLRQADLAAGGQGAPITPIADWILFRDAAAKRAIVNLGGFCNVTVLPRCEDGRNALEGIAGFDVCACNQILDCVARTALKRDFDEDGAAALRGSAKPQAAAELLDLLQRQRKQNRSLGTGDELLRWVETTSRTEISPHDFAATAVDAIARCIGASIAEHMVDEMIVAGGGAKNRALVQAIARHSQNVVRSSADFGVPIDAREAMAFAILGALCADRVPITLPQVTGCASPAPISGVWCAPSGWPLVRFA